MSDAMGIMIAVAMVVLFVIGMYKLFENRYNDGYAQGYTDGYDGAFAEIEEEIDIPHFYIYGSSKGVH